MNDWFPIVDHACCQMSSDEREFADRVAVDVLERHPELKLSSLLSEFRATELVPAPSLHLDDLSEIRRVENSDQSFFQERARVRAGDGDFLATSWHADETYEQYCRGSLHLGKVDRIHPRQNEDLEHSDGVHLAEALWKDRRTRRDLIRAIRQDGLRYLHPHMGSHAVWHLALLLHQASHRPLKVIGAPPEVTVFANDKGQFTRLVHRMFGPTATPPSHVVWNTANAAKRIQQIDGEACCVALKLPNAAGGEGNLVLSMETIRNHSLTEVDRLLREQLPQLRYEDGDELLVTTWQTGVIAAPSAQLWLPPSVDKQPILEGLFVQRIETGQGRFTGFGAADIPHDLRARMTRQCLQLGRVYQRLGYVGRCSFDTVLVGPDLESSQMQFIECNGRWGGTSLPMTLMNRVFGDWKSQPFATRTLKIPGSRNLSFQNVLAAIGKDVYDHRLETGDVILMNPRRMTIRDEVSVIVLRSAWTDNPDDRFAEIANRVADCVAAAPKGKRPPSENESTP
ncbi:hypothetical protein K227x_04840 [Rubripirellula lacrimiformis]|uniref:Pre ATP-grasp domain-containing protein n=1 Tax=Rubripirellula lacrimiformis TaxID=1930273 RepID=A0A517N4Q3_9BACT|nr:hypothetical protein [Rubripirellula lacrimiformis]QDT02113.1 hypothetical protein K227x_04840 [Rubripirellula lacrimiformis]